MRTRKASTARSRRSLPIAGRLLMVVSVLVAGGYVFWQRRMTNLEWSCRSNYLAEHFNYGADDQPTYSLLPTHDPYAQRCLIHRTYEWQPAWLDPIAMGIGAAVAVFICWRLGGAAIRYVRGTPTSTPTRLDPHPIPHYRDLGRSRLPR